jgi:hypothetical protein
MDGLAVNRYDGAIRISTITANAGHVNPSSGELPSAEIEEVALKHNLRGLQGNVCNPIISHESKPDKYNRN